MLDDGGGGGAASAAAPATAVMVDEVSLPNSDPDSSVPSGSNAIASPCASFGNGIRTGSAFSAATTSPSGIG